MSGFTSVFSAGLLGSYRFEKSDIGPFLVGGPGLSYTSGSANRVSGVRPTLEFGVGVASKAIGGPIFVVQGRYVAHGVLANYFGELTLGLGVRF